MGEPDELAALGKLVELHDSGNGTNEGWVEQWEDAWVHARHVVTKRRRQLEFQAHSDARLAREAEEFARLSDPAEPGQCGYRWYDLISSRHIVCVLDPDHGSDHNSRRVSGSAFTRPRS